MHNATQNLKQSIHNNKFTTVLGEKLSKYDKIIQVLFIF